MSASGANTYCLPERSLADLFFRLAREGRVLAPLADGNRLAWGEVRPDTVPTPNPARMVAPPRLAPGRTGSGRVVIFGAKACDIPGLRGDHAARGKLLLLTMDCEEVLPGCFCTAVGGLPFPQSGFDLNFSRVERGFLVEVGTPEGEAVVERNLACFRGPTPGQLEERDERRRMRLSRLRGRRRRRALPRDDEACAGCLACLVICPVSPLSPGGRVKSVRAARARTRCTGCGRCASACPLGRVGTARS